MPISYSEELGFITASPSNLGSGMRASVMLFLPACAFTGKIDEIFASAKENGLTIRGIYGEGSKSTAYFYQISISVCFAHTQKSLIKIDSDYSICFSSNFFLLFFVKLFGTVVPQIGKGWGGDKI